jgi:molybdopterin-containing oxidoreductase family iron-sulfur binding subunit
MEKCTFCVQRIRRKEREIEREGRELKDGELQPACVQTCPTDALVFGNIKDPNSKVAKLAKDDRHYKLLEELGTDPNVIYLKKVEEDG